MNTSNSLTPSAEMPTTPRAFVWHYTRLYLGWSLLMVGLEFSAALCSTLIPFAIGKITGAVSGGLWNGMDIFSAAKPALLLLALLACGEMLLSRSMSLCMIYIRPQQKRRITADLFAYLQKHSHRYFSEHFAGSLSQRISEAGVGVLEISWMLMVEFLPIMVTLVGALILMSLASLWLGASLLAWTLVYVGLSYVLARRAQVFANRHAEARSVTSGKIVDAVTNLNNIRYFARGDYEQAYLKRFMNSEVAAARRSFLYMERIRWLQDGMALLLRLGLVIIALLLWQRGRIDVAAFVTTASLGLLIVANAKSLSYQFLHFFESSGNIENSVNTLIRPHELPDRADARDDLVFPRGEIELRELTFGYRASAPIFRQLNLKIAAGQRVGVVGYSGSGKSTLLNLLLRMYDPQAGAILIDGIDIRELTQESLHRQIGLIPQEPGLFHRTLKENIGYGAPEAANDSIEAAARRAHAHDFIQRMEHGYDSLVGERGVKLSGGQRQRIAIARVLLKNARILIMDEATSSLDSATERLIQDSLDEIMGDKTVLVVAHRLSTIAHLDRILVFDDGRIVEDGTHQQLLEKGGAYSRLWSHQIDGRFDDETAVPAAAQGTATAGL
jgi:ATP-binding cassette subfamily B protein